MAMKVRPDYVNPLAAMSQKGNGVHAVRPAEKQGGKPEKAAELQNKQQQLQNQMLLLKAAGTDSAGTTAENQKRLEEELEKVSAELRTAKAVGPEPAVSASRADTQTASERLCRDTYEPGDGNAAAPGLYRLEKDEEDGYTISFIPFSED